MAIRGHFHPWSCCDTLHLRSAFPPESWTLEKSHSSLQDRHFRHSSPVSHRVSRKIQARLGCPVVHHSLRAGTYRGHLHKPPTARHRFVELTCPDRNDIRRRDRRHRPGRQPGASRSQTCRLLPEQWPRLSGSLLLHRHLSQPRPRLDRRRVDVMEGDARAPTQTAGARSRRRRPKVGRPGLQLNSRKALPTMGIHHARVGSMNQTTDRTWTARRPAPRSAANRRRHQ